MCACMIAYPCAPHTVPVSLLIGEVSCTYHPFHLPYDHWSKQCVYPVMLCPSICRIGVHRHPHTLTAYRAHCAAHSTPLSVTTNQEFQVKATLEFSNAICSLVNLPVRHGPDDVWRTCSDLHSDEIRFANSLKSNHSALLFCAGRYALRKSLRSLYHSEPSYFDLPILKDVYGAPVVPRGFCGSISHKESIAIGLAAVRDTEGTNWGVDIEYTQTQRVASIDKRILTDRELNSLGNLTEVTRIEETMLRFSLKESLFKAIHPVVCRHVRFKEVEVYPFPDGTAEVILGDELSVHGFCDIRAYWCKIDWEYTQLDDNDCNRRVSRNYWVTSVKSYCKNDPENR